MTGPWDPGKVQRAWHSGTAGQLYSGVDLASAQNNPDSYSHQYINILAFLLFYFFLSIKLSDSDNQNGKRKERDTKTNK